jgi:ABC-type dipeptide/oligopeptide/nickel transport system permease component
VLQGVILVFALGVAMANLLADVTVACADPRIRAGAR